MSFKDLISVGDQQNLLWRSFLQALEDQGGSNYHLQRFLADTREDRTFLGEMARRTMGRIWELVGEEIDLGDIDFDSPMREFHAQFADQLDIAPGAIPDWHSSWSETAPTGPCRYRLIHMDEPVLLREVLQAPLYDGEEYAGWRELLVYALKLQPADFSLCTIIAAGSRLSARDGDGFKINETDSPAFPSAWSHDGQDKPSIGWRGVKRPEEDKYDMSCFFLIRVYQK